MLGLPLLVQMREDASLNMVHGYRYYRKNDYLPLSSYSIHHINRDSCFISNFIDGEISLYMVPGHKKVLRLVVRWFTVVHENIG